jgi:pyruvate/2-oxoacid:ferredoxin oxidoreductase beta subunit
LGVTCGLFPLLELFDGQDWRISLEPPFEGLDEYLNLQGRFSTLTDEQREGARAYIEKRWRDLRSVSRSDRSQSSQSWPSSSQGTPSA